MLLSESDRIIIELWLEKEFENKEFCEKFMAVGPLILDRAFQSIDPLIKEDLLKIVKEYIDAQRK